MQSTDASIIYPTTSPENFSGLVSWHEADALNSIVQDKAPVQTCFDLSKNNFDVTQATVSARPTLRMGACNGHSTMRFDGVSNELLNTTYFDFNDTYTLIVVAAFAAGAAVGSGLVSIETAGGVSQLDIILTGGNVIGRGIDSVGTKITTPATFDPRNGKFNIFTIVNTNAALTLYINSIQQGTIAYVSPNPNVTTRLHFGNLGGTFFTGDIAAVIAYNVARSISELLTLEQNYCRRKFFGTES